MLILTSYQNSQRIPAMSHMPPRAMVLQGLDFFFPFPEKKDHHCSKDVLCSLSTDISNAACETQTQGGAVRDLPLQKALPAAVSTFKL